MLEESKQTEIQEEPVEEQVEQPKEEESSKEVSDVVDMLSKSVPVEKPEEGALPYDEIIEQARLAFSKKYRAGRRNSYIAMAVVLALAVGAVICIGLNGLVFKILGWSLIGVGIVGMIVFYIVTRNSMPRRTKEYIDLVTKELNVRNFSNTKFTDVTTDPTEKLEVSDCISDAIYLNINNIASRNVVCGHFAGRSFRVGDCGLYTGAGKQRASLFVGKYMTYPNDLHFEGRYIIAIKGSSAVDLPNDIEDLVPVIEEGDFIIYGRKDSKPVSDIGKDFLAKIKKIDVKDNLLNLNIVLWSGHCAAYASYSDPIMTLPFEKEFNKAANEQYAKNMVDIYEAFELLVKKEK